MRRPSTATAQSANPQHGETARGAQAGEGEASRAEAAPAFDGYSPPTSSTTYTPNQLFDVVLPHASRGCLRLVAYLIQKTLRISDQDGNPMYPEAHASFKELVEKAGIGRGRIKEAIQEAIDRRLIECLRFGQPHAVGEKGFSALYSLRWDERPEYVTDPEAFDGFFAGQGNYTRIPNDFFDHTIPHEPLSVVRVVGVVIRHTIGWQQKVGFRRQQVRMSFREIMRRSGIGSRSTVCQAVKDAIERNHIERVEEGAFDPFSSVATTWGVKWTDAPKLPVVEPDSAQAFQNRDRASVPESRQAKGSEIETAEAFPNRDVKRPSVPKSRQAKGSRIETGDGSETETGTVPESRREAFQNRSSIETTLKRSPKQQAKAEAGVVAGGDPLALLVRELVAVGVTPQKARLLVQEEPAETIRRQLDWLSRRVVKKTAAGLLIACIEQDLPEPGAVQETAESLSPARLFARGFYAELSAGGGESMAEPTPADERRAQAILDRLKVEGGEPAQTAGRSFGAFVRGKEKGKSNPVRLMSLAVTLYADEFLSLEGSKGQATARRTTEEAKKAHQERFSSDYEAFVLSLAERLESDDALLESFEGRMAGKLAERRKLSARAAEMLEGQLRDENERARLLVEFAQERGAVQVPSFWDWDRTRNDQPFGA